jgi:SAM-dependent methyltransferase
MDKSLLIRLFGYRAAFVHGDFLMLDRWNFVKRVMPRTGNGETVFDVGCGSGAFTIGLAKRGYRATGLSWDERNQSIARHRARLVGADRTEFPIGDARVLDTLEGHEGRYDYVLSLENIEHILDDRKLMQDLAACLKPGGWLVLSTPNKDYRAITAEDDGPFPTVETGWHVRRGYSPAMLRELAASAGLEVEAIGGCSGFLSQKLTWFLRKGGLFGWAATLPLRWLPSLLDPLIRKLFGYPEFSLTLVAYKPRFAPGS